MHVAQIDEAKHWRRLYKTRWERAKRKRLRESRFEIVELELPRSLAKRLHAWTPKGVSFANFLRRVLSAGTGGKPLWESAEAFNRRAAAYGTTPMDNFVCFRCQEETRQVREVAKARDRQKQPRKAA